MRIKFLIILFSFSCIIKAQEKLTLKFDYRNLNFKDFVIKAEKQFNLKFLYKEEWVKDLKIGDYSNCKTLTCVLDNLFNNSLLFYYIDDSENLIITKDFALNDLSESARKGGLPNPKIAQSLTYNKQHSTQNSLVNIGNSNERNKPGKVTITGYVTYFESGIRASGVSVFDKNLAIGTTTNENGLYSLSLPRGFHQIQFSSIGFQEQKFNVNLNSSGELNVELKKSIINLNEIIISARKNLMLDRLEVGVEKINISSFKMLPTAMGESDIMKSMILLPGVQSVGEGSAGFNVRGGSADQNLILLQGAPIYNASHFFGFFSAVNSDIIKDVTLYKGGIPSRFGGRISSVLDIDTREGNMKEFAGSAGISPIATRLNIEGPLIKDTLSYIIAARSTYSNYILGLINNPFLNNNKATFYDLNGKISYALNKNNKIDAFLYYSHDNFRLRKNANYNYCNSILALKWFHRYNSRFTSALSINNSAYNYEIQNNTVTTESYLLTHKINSSEIKFDFDWLPGSQKINF